MLRARLHSSVNATASDKLNADVRLSVVHDAATQVYGTTPSEDLGSFCQDEIMPSRGLGSFCQNGHAVWVRSAKIGALGDQ